MKKSKVIFTLLGTLAVVLLVATFSRSGFKNDDAKLGALSTDAVADTSPYKSLTTPTEIIKAGGVLNSKWNSKSKNFDISYYTNSKGEKMRTPISVSGEEIVAYGQDIYKALTGILATETGNGNELSIECGVRNGNIVTIFTFEATAHNVWWCIGLGANGRPHCDTLGMIW